MAMDIFFFIIMSFIGRALSPSALFSTPIRIRFQCFFFFFVFQNEKR